MTVPLEDLIAAGPKSLRPALWVIAFAVAAGSVAIVGMAAVESKAQIAATMAVAPMADRVAKLETAQDTIWRTMGAKLDAISLELTQTRTDVAVLSQKVEDSKPAQRSLR